MLRFTFSNPKLLLLFDFVGTDNRICNHAKSISPTQNKETGMYKQLITKTVSDALEGGQVAVGPDA